MNSGTMAPPGFTFPQWEYFIPSVGILYSQGGNISAGYSASIAQQKLSIDE